MKKILFLMLLCSQLAAQSFTNGFNFNIPSSDTSSRMFLPVFPKKAIGDSNFVSINADGKFSVAGKRIRFWGTNCVADAAFPDKSIVENIAGRLRKFGFNLVRLHHMDNPGWGKSLLGQTSTRSLNPTTLDLLDYYISRLKANGVYVNVNLHVSRTFTAADGVADVDSIPEMGKVVNFIDPYILSLHKEYAQQLLTHVNPYTHLPLDDDPVMAMVEITNENSLYRAFRDNQLKPIKSGGILPYRYSHMLDSLWMNFLKTKYTKTATLQNAWDVGIVVKGNNEQMVNGGFEKPNQKNYWGLEQHETAKADTSRDNSIAYNGSSSFKVNVTVSTGTDWHIQFKQPTLVLKKDSVYTISFAVKSNASHPFTVSLMNDASPWNSYSAKSLVTSTAWQVFTLSAKATEFNNGHGRLSFSIGKEVGTFWFDNISVTNAGVAGLDSNESLEANNILRIDYSDCPGYTNQRVKDISQFYIELHRKYFQNMLNYLKNDLHVKVPIVTSNWTVGPTDLASMSDGDYVDNHAYWDHPQFPNIPWSSTDWLINNTPMVKEPDNSTIPNLMTGVPEVGKPFTISEYDHPSPNIYQVESVLFTAGYASFYDADALLYFAYDEGSQYGEDKIDGFFSINHNPVYMAFFPSVAYAFRNNYVEPSINPIVINYSSDTLFSLPKYDNGDWRGTSFIERKTGLLHAVKIGKYFANATSDFSALQSEPVNPYKTDTGEITWDSNNGTIRIAAQNFLGAAGYLSSLKDNAIGEATILDFKANDFGAITWLSLTGKKLSKSDRSSMTLGSKPQNTNMIWDGTNTVHDKWGNAPTQIYPLYIKLDLNIEADSIKVFPLDSYGRENVYPPFTVKPTLLHHFIVELDQTKYKTLWFGIEKFGEGNPTDVETKNNLPREYKLEQNFPNPFNPSTTINYQLLVSGYVSLKVYDILGREVATLVNKFQKPGYYNVTFSLSVRGLSSGVYFYRIKAGEFRASKKFILMK